MFRMFVPDVPLSGWRWYLNMVFATILCLSFGGAMGYGSWTSATQDHDYAGAAVIGAISLLTLSVPFVGISLKNRTEEIRCPKHVVVSGRPALHFPGDRRGMIGSAILYPLLAGPLVALCVPPPGEEFHPSVVIFLIPAAFCFSYTLFALAGRFKEDGTYITERGVTIRARGLRAELPWSSIAGSTTYLQSPFPYERIAIHLHPGSPREVSVTVPWWIGSPRPRGDTVFLTKVQVPGFYREGYGTNPGNWIDRYAHNPPSAEQLQVAGQNDEAGRDTEQIRRNRFIESVRLRAAPREQAEKSAT